METGKQDVLARSSSLPKTKRSKAHDIPQGMPFFVRRAQAANSETLMSVRSCLANRASHCFVGHKLTIPLLFLAIQAPLLYLVGEFFV